MKMSFEWEKRLRKWTISNLMKYIVLGSAILYVLTAITPGLYRACELTRAGLLRGEIWRLATFIFLPASWDLISVALSLYCYWLIGSQLESRWGALRFNLFYFTGVVATVIVSLIAGYGSITHLNMSLFLAFAILYPEYPILLFFILPVRMKYIALLDLIIMAISFITGGWATRLGILVAIGNIMLFLGGDFITWMRRTTRDLKTRWAFRRKMRM